MQGAYFDHNATTPLDPRVREAMLPWMGERWGNASSAHRFGQSAHAAVERARASVAGLLGARPEEIVFTASGTEANNAVLRTALAACGQGGHLVVSALEHPSILGAAGVWAPAVGATVSHVLPDTDGVVPVESFLAARRPETRLAALMLANNELGTLQPVAEWARACRERGIPLLCDAVQAVGKIPVRVAELGADYVTIGAHKFHGPPGAAALWVRSGAPLEPLLVGGGQERGRRASTSNVAALVGFGTACELAGRELEERRAHLAALRERFEAGLSSIPDTVVHGTGAPRLPHTTNVALRGLLNQDLLMRLDLAGYAISTGAACGSGVVEPSATLRALGLDRDEALASIRVSFGMANRVEEVDAFLPVLAREVEALRATTVGRSRA